MWFEVRAREFTLFWTVGERSSQLMSKVRTLETRVAGVAQVELWQTLTVDVDYLKNPQSSVKGWSWIRELPRCTVCVFCFLFHFAGLPVFACESENAPKGKLIEDCRRVFGGGSQRAPCRSSASCCEGCVQLCVYLAFTGW